MKTRRNTGIMFNAESKNKFINSDQCEQPSFTTHFFENTYELEKRENKDLIYFPSDKGKELLESFKYKSTVSVKQAMNVIIAYSHFCGLQDSYFLNLSPESYKELVFKKIKPFTGEEIQNIILGQNYISEKPRVAFMILAPFEGILGKEKSELLNLKKKDLLPNQTLKVGDRIISISSQLDYIFKRICSVYDLSENDWLLGGVTIYSVNMTYNRLKETVNRPDFTPENIFWSGIWCRLNQLIDMSSTPLRFVMQSPELENIKKQYGKELLSNQAIKLQLKKYI